MTIFARADEELDCFLKAVSITFNQEVDFPTYISPVNSLVTIFGFKVCRVICSETRKTLFSIHGVEDDIFVYCRFPVFWFQPGYGMQGFKVPLLAGPFHQDTSPPS